MNKGAKKKPERGGATDDGPLFIVDNSPGGRSGLNYLAEWCELASSFDIATGFFEVGALMALDGRWQQLEKIRILMGDEVSQRTKKAFVEAVTARARHVLDDGLARDKNVNPFLEGAAAVVDALASKQIEARVYSQDKFHAKSYITHGKLDVVGSQALVGSSNFTYPGLTENIELNIKVESGAEVAQLQAWFEEHWNDAEDVTPELLKTIGRHTRDYDPFEVYARALFELFSDQDQSATEWEQAESSIFGTLDEYQREAYWALMDIAGQHRGALLCDGVGLGKTFVGLMLIERLVVRERKRVVLFAPKATKEAVWVPALKKRLPLIGGVSGGSDFSNLVVFSHTDLTRRTVEFEERFERVAEMADVVLIDEAHHFRNTGRHGDTWEEKSRYWRMYDLIGGSANPKTVFMLTATPINNSLNDFRHMVELFSRQDDTYFARTLGVASVAGRINAVTKSFKDRTGSDYVAENVPTANELLSADPLFNGLVVQRSRAYARRSQEQEHGSASAIFPERGAPEVADYSVRKTYGKLLKMVEAAFAKDKPLFALPIYYPLAYYSGPDDSIDPIQENRQQQVVGLIRTNFLKRFESSVHAFERSCDRLMRKLIAFVSKNAVSEAEERTLNRFLDRHSELLGVTRARQLELWPEEEAEDESDEDVILPELLDAAELLDRSLYDVPAIVAETYLDMEQLADFLDETRKFESKSDDKLQRLVKLLRRKDMGDGRKVIIFTEFADTARYLKKHLGEKGIDGVFQLDSSTKVDRAEVLQRFSPYYNDSSSGELADRGLEEIRVLVATDVLSEGLNLQDATRLVNYDIHWNPVRLMQRVGRVDRRLDPDAENRLVNEHPDQAGERGHVKYWNFLPPDEIDTLLKLYSRVSGKTLLISKALGIEHGKLLTPDDDFAILKELNANYEGETTRVEELHLEYQALLGDYPDLVDSLRDFPEGIYSGREREEGGPVGVFFCLRLPALDAMTGDFTLAAGPPRWYFADLASGTILEDVPPIADQIRSTSGTPRSIRLERDALLKTRKSVLDHVRNTYLKQVDAPLDAPKPRLICWMELNEE